MQRPTKSWKMLRIVMISIGDGNFMLLLPPTPTPPVALSLSLSPLLALRSTCSTRCCIATAFLELVKYQSAVKEATTIMVVSIVSGGVEWMQNENGVCRVPAWYDE